MKGCNVRSQQAGSVCVFVCCFFFLFFYFLVLFCNKLFSFGFPLDAIRNVGGVGNFPLYRVWLDTICCCCCVVASKKLLTRSLALSLSFHTITAITEFICLNLKFTRNLRWCACSCFCLPLFLCSICSRDFPDLLYFVFFSFIVFFCIFSAP